MDLCDFSWSQPTFGSAVTSATTDWELGSFEQARPWPPWATGTHGQPGSLLTSSPSPGDIQYWEGPCAAQALLPGVLSTGVPTTSESASPGAGFCSSSAGVISQPRTSSQIPGPTCRPPPLQAGGPCSAVRLGAGGGARWGRGLRLAVQLGILWPGPIWESAAFFRCFWEI